MLINPIHNDRPIITRTTRRILPGVRARHRITRQIAIIVREKRRNTSIQESLHYVVVVDDTRRDKARSRIEDIRDDEAGDLGRRHGAGIDT